MRFEIYLYSIMRLQLLQLASVLSCIVDVQGMVVLKAVVYRLWNFYFAAKQ